MARTLNVLGIIPPRPGSLRILTDCRATRENIMTGLKWLVKGAKKGDLLIFYYSGHGSQVADVSGDDIDGKDETICPHDFATAGMIKDDHLRSIFSGIAAGVNLEVILDSCHSGTGTRERAALDAMPEDQKVTIRYVEPPLDYQFFLDEDPTIPVRGFLRGTAGEKEAVVVPGLNHALWAACEDNQTAGEGPADGAMRGFFSYCFCKILRRAGTNITRRRLDSLVAGCLRQTFGAGQVPQLEGTKTILNEKVFT